MVELKFKNTTTKRKSVTEITYRANTVEDLNAGVGAFMQAQMIDTSVIVNRQLDTIDRMAARQAKAVEKAAARTIDQSLFESLPMNTEDSDK